MKTKNIFPAIVFVLMFFSAMSQTPGYMGKHLTLGYSNNLSPAFLGPTANSFDMGLNTTHSFNLEYTIRNRTNLCLSYQMFTTGVTSSVRFEETVPDPYGGLYTNYYLYNSLDNMPMRLHSNNICIGLKFFPVGSLAPVGRYKKLELVLLFSHLTYAQNGFTGTDNNGSSVRKALGTGDYSYKNFAVTYTLGRQRVFFDCLVLDYGIQFGVLPSGAFANLISNTGIITPSGDIESVLRSETNKRLFMYEAVNLHLGIGFLAL